MMKIFRWQGVVGFVVIIAIMAGFAMFLAEPIVKAGLETALTKMNGARVDIKQVNINYSPVRLALNDIQVADPSQPMMNTVQISQAELSIETGPLLLGKVIVDKMNLSDMQIETQRRVSGAIPQAVSAEPVDTVESDVEDKQESDISLPSLELPDVNKVVNTESLESTKKFNVLDEDIKNTKERWAELERDLKDKQRWGDYEKRYKNVRAKLKGNFKEKIQAVKDAKSLKKDLDKEAARIKAANKEIKIDIKRLDDEFQAAKKAPAEDYDRLKSKYSLDSFDAENISRALFGNKATEWIALLHKWYARLAPYLADEEEPETPVERSKGVFVKFKEYQPQPDFHLKLASLTAQLPSGVFSGTVSNVSSDQKITKKPAEFELIGKQLKNRDAERIAGRFDFTRPGQRDVNISYSLKGFAVNDYAISKSETLSLTLQQAKMDLLANANITAGHIKADVNTDFNDTRFYTNKTSGKSLNAMLGTAFSEIEQFNVQSELAGEIKRPTFSLTSDLDKKLGNKVSAQIDQLKIQYEKDLKARIKQLTDDKLQSFQSELDKIKAINAEIEAKQKELKQKLSNLKIK